MTTLTEKQINYRRWYQENKNKICSGKRKRYQEINGNKDKPAKPKKCHVPAKVKPVSPLTSNLLKHGINSKRSIEDYILAKELDLSIDDICGG